jgi:molecular chaperone DnaK
MEGGEPKIIPSAEGGNLVPSVVAISKNGERLVGEIAKRQAIVNPENTVFSIKRLIGRKFEEASVQYDINGCRTRSWRLPTATVASSWVARTTPQEISAMNLQKLKADAEGIWARKSPTRLSPCRPTSITVETGHEGRRAIAGLTFWDHQRAPPRRPSVRPGQDRKTEPSPCTTFRAAHLTISSSTIVDGTFQVQSTNGDTHIGGDDIDHASCTGYVMSSRRNRATT